MMYDLLGIGASFAIQGMCNGMQNAYPADTMRNRLDAAKLALHRPESVERLPNGRGWRLKPADSIDLNRMLAKYHGISAPKGHDHPEWV